MQYPSFSYPAPGQRRRGPYGDSGQSYPSPHFEGGIGAGPAPFSTPNPMARGPAPQMSSGPQMLSAPQAPQLTPFRASTIGNNIAQHVGEKTYVDSLGSAPSAVPTGTTTSLGGKMVPQYQDSPAALLARRQAFSARQGILADAPLMPYGNDNYTQGRYVTQEYNHRANQVTGAEVGVMGSQAAYNNAQASAAGTVAPAQADALRGQATRDIAGANASNTLAPAEAEATRAQGRAAEAMGGYNPQQIKAMETELSQLRTLVQHYQTQMNKPAAAAPRQIGLSQAENDAAKRVGYPAVMGMRGGHAPGDPTTQPTTQPSQPDGATAGADSTVHVNPQTGERIRWDGRQWVQMQ